jgi:predicted TPR repeat methyltransferase
MSPSRPLEPTDVILAVAQATLGRAIHLHQLGRLDEAEPLYVQVLEALPAFSDALHYYGMLHHERGRTEEGIALLEKAVQHSPDDVEASNNLGNLYLLNGRPEEAELRFLEVLRVAPDAVSTRFNYGMLLLSAGRIDESIDALERTLAQVDDADVRRGLGEAYLRKKRFVEACGMLEKAVALRPDDAELVRLSSHAHEQTLDFYERTLAPESVVQTHLRRWLNLAPAHPIACHALAAHSGMGAPPRCSEEYVRRTFDQFADSFDEVLGRLGYCGVSLSMEALEQASPMPSANAGLLNVLDAGCGTGALGPLIRPRCQHLVGVDLSPRMLDKAKGRQVYDELVEADLESFLSKSVNAERFDVVVCADTLVYFGDLSRLFEAVVHALVPGGLFVFTVELLDDRSDAAGHALVRQGRYQHTQVYLRAELESAGAAVLDARRVTSLRRENQQDIPGLVVSARRGR